VVLNFDTDPKGDAETKVTLTQTDIPKGVDEEELENMWYSHYWDVLIPKNIR
jgi:hypothetical protein